MFRRAVGELPYRLALLIGQRRRIGSLPMVFLLRSDAKDMAARRLEDAVSLLGEYAPHHLSRLRRVARSILIFGAHNRARGFYLERLRCIVVTEHFILSEETDSASVALHLVHECTHARLAAMGIPYAEGWRARSELACARQELSVAQRLPDSRLLVDTCERRIALWSTYTEADWKGFRLHVRQRASG